MTDYKGPNAFSDGRLKPAKVPKIIPPYQRAPDGVVRNADGPAFNNRFPKSRYQGGGQSDGGNILINVTAPFVTGTPTVGETLSCSIGTWTGSPTGYVYQWERDGVAIGGATSSTYLLVSDDTGTSVSCLVTASNGTASVSQISNVLDVSGGGGGRIVLNGIPLTFNGEPILSGTEEDVELIDALAALTGHFNIAGLIDLNTAGADGGQGVHVVGTGLTVDQFFDAQGNAEIEGNAQFLGTVRASGLRTTNNPDSNDELWADGASDGTVKVSIAV